MAQFYLLYMMVIGFLCALWVFGKLACKIVKLKLHPYSSEAKSARHLRYYLITTKINLRLWLAFVGAFLIYVFYNVLFIMGELIAIGRRSNHFIDNAFEMLFFMIQPLMFIFVNFVALFLIVVIMGVIIDWIKIKRGKLKPTSLFDPKEVFKL
ncbi:hypothetical protein [Helicobacter burdigaliensis]|uniref:hypothetical protein n=1 Tax=Helicobacter burdigaliensis TaxID=2315334 RepID=UPI0039ED0D0A